MREERRDDPQDPLLLAGCLASSLALADACQVQTRPASTQVPGVEAQTCYEYPGMPAGSVDWSCSNESKDMLQSENTRWPVARAAGSAAAPEP